jgi:ankyrin repeat protein
MTKHNSLVYFKNIICASIVLVCLFPRITVSFEFKSKESYKKEIEQRGIQYSVYNFSKAAGKGEIEIVRLFINAGIDVNSKLGDTGITALHLASSKGNIDIVKLLLEKGANVDSGSTTGTPLVFAAWYGQTEIAELLLKKGADINSNTGLMTPLIGASLGCYPETVKLLLKKGADVNRFVTEDASKITALSYAKAEKCSEVIKLLIRAGARE